MHQQQLSDARYFCLELSPRSSSLHQRKQVLLSRALSLIMSGRLIILPKKSWHPGKRENIEKVLRDERLAAEEAAAARERAREIAQEGIVETLSKKRYDSVN